MREQQLETLIGKVLGDRFPDAKISEVVVRSDIDGDGDRVLRVAVVVDGASEHLNRDALVGFVRHLRSRLDVERREEFPLLSFISRNEAKKLNLESV
jgi:hypothetical protein